MSDLGLYVHIPFCKRKCRYCDFYSAPATGESVSAFSRALVSQIRNSPDAGAKISTVYFGGGTPSLLSERDFSAVAEALKDTFDLSSLREWTVEGNPESITPEKAACWRENGTNRVSMGCQTFSDRLLKELGRLHDARQAKSAFSVLRDAGFPDVSIDLMEALPGQTEVDLRNDLSTALSLAPEHLSVYLLRVEPDTPFGREGVAEADEETQRSFYLLTDGIMTAAGYEHYEISNYALPGHRAVHNTAYWQGKEYLAFGPGAAGYRRGIRYRIPADTAAYVRENGLIAPITEETVDPAEAAREAVFLGLRTCDGIPVSAIPKQKMPLARALAGEGDAVFRADRFALTAKGFLISDYVTAEFLSAM